MSELKSLSFTTEFLQSFADRKLTAADRAAVLKALELLDANERHPSLRVHALQGEWEGSWSASASRSLRIVFTRLADGRKEVASCTKHYDD